MNEYQVRALVRARSGGRCERCGGISQLSCHHRLKRGQGGAWSCENIVQVCGNGVSGCHGWIEANPNDAEFEGWHVRPWNDPAEIPVRLLHADWFLLLPDGGVLESDEPEREPDPEGLSDPEDAVRED